jgi:hypothetical protein
MRLICQNDIVGFRHSIVFGSVRIQLQAQAPRLMRNSFRGHGRPLVPASRSFATCPMFTLRETMRECVSLAIDDERCNSGCDGVGGGLPTTQHSTTLFHRCDHQARWPDGPSSSSCTEGGLRWPLAVLALTQFNFAHADTESTYLSPFRVPGGLHAPCPRAITAVIDKSCRERKKKLTGITKAKKFNLDISRTSYCRRSLLASSPPDSESVRLQNVVHVSWGTYTRVRLNVVSPSFLFFFLFKFTKNSPLLRAVIGNKPQRCYCLLVQPRP